jgi:hypothetical protein
VVDPRIAFLELEQNLPFFKGLITASLLIIGFSNEKLICFVSLWRMTVFVRTGLPRRSLGEDGLLGQMSV